MKLDKRVVQRRVDLMAAEGVRFVTNTAVGKDLPATHLLDYGQEEEAAVFGADPREYCVTTKRFVGDASGRVKQVHAIRVEWTRDETGRPVLKELPGTEKVWPADLVLLAMGFLGPEREGPIEQLGIELDGRGNVAANADKMTSVPGIFTAGDMTRGQSLVVWAIAEGRAAARGVDRYLMGETVLP